MNHSQSTRVYVFTTSLEPRSGGKDDVRPAAKSRGVAHRGRAEEKRRAAKVHEGTPGDGLFSGQDVLMQLN